MIENLEGKGMANICMIIDSKKGGTSYDKL